MNSIIFISTADNSMSWPYNVYMVRHLKLINWWIARRSHHSGKDQLVRLYWRLLRCLLSGVQYDGQNITIPTPHVSLTYPHYINMKLIENATFHVLLNYLLAILLRLFPTPKIAAISLGSLALIQFLEVVVVDCMTQSSVGSMQRSHYLVCFWYSIELT